MNPKYQTLTGKNARIKNLSVTRFLPNREKKMVGPFIFLDHMGPETFVPGVGIDVAPHPHIGIATLTYLFKGSLHHRDSLGNSQVIIPGEVNWMTAGKGIVHSERSPIDFRAKGGEFEGLQCWVAIPAPREKIHPFFANFPRSECPTIKKSWGHWTILAGEFLGLSSPVEVLSPLVFGEFEMEPNQSFSLITRGWDLAIFPVEGQITLEGENLGSGSLHLLKSAKVTLGSSTGGKGIILGGPPFPGNPTLWWNFVSHFPNRIEKAKFLWKEGEFPLIPGDKGESLKFPGQE